MIIVELSRLSATHAPRVHGVQGFLGVEGGAIALLLPTREWAALGEPESVHIVVSEKPLSVGRAGDVREERPR